MITPRAIDGKPFYFDDSLNSRLLILDEKIKCGWDKGQLNLDLQRILYTETRLDEIYHSNRIEGNRLTYDETRQVIQNGDIIASKPLIDYQETMNLSAALDFAQEIAFDRSQSPTQNFLRQFHAILMKGIGEDAGQYRNTQNFINGSSHSTPDAFLVPQLMTELSDYLLSITVNSARLSESPVFCAAAAHVLFVQIHPFTDGNGRTARALMNLILRRHGYPPSIIPEDDRSRYIGALEFAWGNGDLTPLIGLILEHTC